MTDRVVALPVADHPRLRPADLLTLCITTASRRLTPEQLAAQPLSGAALALRVDMPGLPEHTFANGAAIR